MAPNIGCDAPHVNCPTAMAKLMVTMPKPVALFKGDTNRPNDCRAPMVIAQIAAAVITRGQSEARVTVAPETFTLVLRALPPHGITAHTCPGCGAVRPHRPSRSRR